MLLAAENFARYVVFGAFLLERGYNVFYVFVGVLLVFEKLGFELGGYFGFAYPEAGVLELYFYAVHSEAVGQRGVNIESFARDALLLFGSQ